MQPIPEDRALTSEEASLVRWLLEHGVVEAHAFLDQIARARVVSRCACCASVDFVIEGSAYSGNAPFMLADFRIGNTTNGVCVFARDGKLAGLEVYDLAGEQSPASLPSIRVLVPLAPQKA